MEQGWTQPELIIEPGASLRAVSVDPGNLGALTAGMKALPIEVLSAGGSLPTDSFVPTFEGDEHNLCMVRLLRAEQTMPAGLLGSLKTAGLELIYVPNDQLGAMVDFLGPELERRIADPKAPDSTKAKLLYNHAVLIVDQAMNSERMGRNLRQGRYYIENLLDFLHQSPKAVESLAKMLALDYSLYTHSVNTCLLTTSFARFLGAEHKKAGDMGLGALYHDIGKSRIPQDILRKPGPLNHDEWDAMRRHPTRGGEILGDHGSFPDLGMNMVVQHHENLDGSGYPQKLIAGQIPTESRIMRIVDAYDAITSTRCYKDGATAADGIRLMQMEMSDQVDRDLFVRFIEFLGVINPNRRSALAEAYAWILT